IDAAGSLQVDALIEAFSRADNIWAAQRVQIMDQLQTRLGSLKGNIYKVERLEAARLAADAMFASADPYYLQGRRSDDKEAGLLRLLSREKLQGSAKKTDAKNPVLLPEHPFFDAVQDLFNLSQSLE
ncbi:MAG: hypothetical protein VW257_08975, partial [Quisquiliibacterium sp.]